MCLYINLYLTAITSEEESTKKQFSTDLATSIFWSIDSFMNVFEASYCFEVVTCK